MKSLIVILIPTMFAACNVAHSSKAQCVAKRDLKVSQHQISLAREYAKTCLSILKSESWFFSETHKSEDKDSITEVLMRNKDIKRLVKDNLVYYGGGNSKPYSSTNHIMLNFTNSTAYFPPDTGSANGKLLYEERVAVTELNYCEQCSCEIEITEVLDGNWKGTVLTKVKFLFLPKNGNIHFGFFSLIIASPAVPRGERDLLSKLPRS